MTEEDVAIWFWLRFGRWNGRSVALYFRAEERDARIMLNLESTLKFMKALRPLRASYPCLVLVLMREELRESGTFNWIPQQNVIGDAT